MLDAMIRAEIRRAVREELAAKFADNDPKLGMQQTADALGINRQTLINYGHKGILPKPIGHLNRFMYRAADLPALRKALAEYEPLRFRNGGRKPRAMTEHTASP